MNRAPFAHRAARSPRSSAILVGALAVLAAACGGGGGHDDPNGPPYHVSGTMPAAANSAIDSDTNAPFAIFTRNDSAGRAQPIGNPVMLGGHLNQPGAYAPDAYAKEVRGMVKMLQKKYRVSKRDEDEKETPGEKDPPGDQGAFDY